MDKKELLIIVYKIPIAGLTRQQAEEQIYQLMENYKMSDDPELIDDYIIKEIWLPTQDIGPDVKVIYPIPHTQNIKSIELENLIEELSTRINENPEGTFSKMWERLLREIKLSRINKINI